MLLLVGSKGHKDLVIRPVGLQGPCSEICWEARAEGGSWQLNFGLLGFSSPTQKPDIRRPPFSLRLPFSLLPSATPPPNPAHPRSCLRLPIFKGHQKGNGPHRIGPHRIGGVGCSMRGITFPVLTHAPKGNPYPSPQLDWAIQPMAPSAATWDPGFQLHAEASVWKTTST